MLKLTFYGGAQEVTGANYLLESDSARILVDCGMFQGSKIAEDSNFEPFNYNVKSVGALIITHAHIDHIGRIPKLVKEGFRGPIFSTPATKDLAEIMLIDSLGVLAKEAGRNNKEVFYGEEDVKKAAELWRAVDYHEKFQIGDFNIMLKDAGHILGSAFVEISARGKKVIFSGDLGNPPTPLLRPTEEITGADFLVIESTYGDRLHEGKDERKRKLERAIEDVVKSRGVLMMPAFSLERTQEILFELNDLVEHGRIPAVPIFLDSPLAILATEIYRKYDRYFNKNAKYIIDSGDAVFKFPGLRFTKKTEESKAISNVPLPKVIIAGSGMSNGGRIIHHEKKYLSDPKSILLIVGYQAVGSLGRIIQDGAKKVKILGEKVDVNAKIEEIHGYSAHPDRDMLMDIVENNKDSLKKVFVVQGEPKSSLFFTQRIRDYLGVDAQAPKYGDSVELV